MRRGHNPLCGDQVTVWLELEGDVVKDVTLRGSGLRHLAGVGVADDGGGQGEDPGRGGARCSSGFHGLVTGTRLEADEAELPARLAGIRGRGAVSRCG